MLLVSVAGAQTASPAPGADQPPLGDYARKVRKDRATKTKPKVFDNDNLPAEDKLSVVGQETATAEAADKSASAAENKDAAAKPAADEQAKKQTLGKPGRTN